MRIYQIDPIADGRWADFVERHPKASIFHTVGWLRALRLTYGYEPVVFTTSSPTGELKNGVVFCRINSWLTGRRLVSLPFSDHCEPLCDSAEDMNFLMGYLLTIRELQKFKYIELRPVNGRFDQTCAGDGFQSAGRYFLHTVDLRPELNRIFRSLDKDSVQRRVDHARRSGLVERCGRSDDLLKEFYALFVATRRRHHLPPVPYVWLQNLIRCQNDALEIRVAYNDKTPIAAILTLRFRKTVYYKYGCSDLRLKKMGATPWLLWRAIEAAQSNGMSEFDMGRTQEDHAGLLRFKNHWVQQPKPLVYWQCPRVTDLDSAADWKCTKHAVSHMPDRLLVLAGKLLYRHIG